MLNMENEKGNKTENPQISGSNTSLPVPDITETEGENVQSRDRTQSISALDSNPEDFQQVNHEYVWPLMC